LRDARIVTDLFLAAKGAWTEDLSREYAAERAERMRRLRYSSALMDVVIGQGVPDRLARLRRISRRMRENHKLVEALEACHIGPWNIAEDAFTPSNLAELAMA